MSWSEWLFGRRLRSWEDETEKIGPATGVAVLGLDALASAAYGPEAALTILLPLGTLGPNYLGPLTAFILALLFAVFFSYRQTIEAYPNGGGSFTVAKENLGRIPGLIAASALSLDYILNVAVAIAAGVWALVSAVPALLPFTLPLCLGTLLFLTLLNLRGVRSAGLLLMLPTYVFVGVLLIAIVAGTIKAILAHGHPVAVIAPAEAHRTVTAASTWLLVRAFASGCAALTGIEAVSNAVPIFREPSVKLARRTLTSIIVILAVLLGGVAFLARAYGITATPPGQSGYQSVLSQLVAAALGRGAWYYLSMAATLLVLILSANTSFSGFPRVCRLLALDEYLPAGFAHRGDRLVYTHGIIVLALFSGALLIVFGGITDRLIPLFALGAFSAFTFSQAGMVMHWRKSREPGARRSLVINGVGAVATAATLLVIAVAKFKEGAWLAILVIPSIVGLLLRVQRHYSVLERERCDGGPLDTSGLQEPIMIVPLRRLDRVARKALRLALSLSADVRAVQILAEELKTTSLADCWCELVADAARQSGRRPPLLTVVHSEYREFFGPLLEHVHRLARENPKRHIAVVVPELVQRRWYHFILPHRATLLKYLLLLNGGPQIVIINAPWYLKD